MSRPSGPGRRSCHWMPLAFVAFLLLAGGAMAAHPSRGQSTSARATSGSGLVLTASPSTGDAPLLVDFSFSTPNGTAPLYEWSFGDGSYLNGSGISYETPSHTYLAPGVYRAIATAVWPAGPDNASLTIVVLSPSLSIHLVATPLNGTAPLTVTFNATPQGGSGTYLSYLWSFGDGGSGSGLDVRYTYETAGDFRAEITVTDSRGASVTAEANITVAAAGTGPGSNNSSAGNGSSDGSTPGGLRSWLADLPAIAIAVLVVGISVFLASAGRVLYRRRAISRAWDPVPVRRPPSPAGSSEPPPPIGPEPVTPTPDPPASVLPTVIVPTVPAPSDPSGLAASRRLALQLLRHMGTLPRVPPGELPGPEWTQAGLSRTVGAGQSAISRVLRRLNAAGIVEAETTHVAGGGRRLRVYRLTPRGERLAHALSDPGAADRSVEIPTVDDPP